MTGRHRPSSMRLHPGQGQQPHRGHGFLQPGGIFKSRGSEGVGVKIHPGQRYCLDIMGSNHEGQADPKKNEPEGTIPWLAIIPGKSGKYYCMGGPSWE